jgi:hypothetical protein
MLLCKQKNMLPGSLMEVMMLTQHCHRLIAQQHLILLLEGLAAFNFNIYQLPIPLPFGALTSH